MATNVIAWLTVYGLSSLIGKISTLEDGTIFMGLFTFGYILANYNYSKHKNLKTLLRYTVFAVAPIALAYFASLIFLVQFGVAYLILTMGLSLTARNLWNLFRR